MIGIIIPTEFKLISKAILAFDNEGPFCLSEIKSGDKRGWRVEAWTYPNKFVRRFIFNNQQDAFDMWIEVNTPSFDPKIYNIDPVEDIYWEFAITQSLVSSPGSNQSFSIPVTWGPANSIECIGGGGPASPAKNSTSTNGLTGCGGGAGAYSKKSSAGYDRNGSVTYQIGSGGLANSDIAGVRGGPGGDTWFNGTVFAGSSCAAKGGTGGSTNTTGSVIQVGVGGAAASGIGDIKNSGGSGGKGQSVATNMAGAGGGGAGGISADGSTALDLVPFTITSSAGGNSDTATGGAATINAGNPGGNGTDFDASHGAGAGGSGGGYNVTGQVGGAAGNYGGASGGPGADNISNTTRQAPDAAQGMIFLTWSPYSYTESYTN